MCDFSSEDGGWRPLDRTKYRLNKGDAQLEETYRREPAHHIPELLSDIGYMVYRARREPREALCRVVRSKVCRFINENLRYCSSVFLMD